MRKSRSEVVQLWDNFRHRKSRNLPLVPGGPFRNIEEILHFDVLLSVKARHGGSGGRRFKSGRPDCVNEGSATTCGRGAFAFPGARDNSRWPQTPIPRLEFLSEHDPVAVDRTDAELSHAPRLVGE